MAQTNVFFDDKDEKVIDKYKKRLMMNKHETIKTILHILDSVESACKDEIQKEIDIFKRAPKNQN